MAQQSTIGKTATMISKDEKYTSVRYHNTDVVKFNDIKIVLNSNGWKTNTTKTRMNQASNQFNLGYNVFQSKHIWYVSMGNTVYDYEDNMTLDRQ